MANAVCKHERYGFCQECAMTPEAAPRTEAGRPSKSVRMSAELVDFLSQTHNGVRWEFGYPGPDGFYEPTVYREAEAAQPAIPVGALDVERLARAMEEAWPHAIAPSNSHRRWAWTKPSHGLAELIAAAYLAAASEPAGGGEG